MEKSFKNGISKNAGWLINAMAESAGQGNHWIDICASDKFDITSISVKTFRPFLPF